MEPDNDTYQVTTTLEEYFRQHEKIASDFMLRPTWVNGQLQFYIHPYNVNGETLDYKVNGNTVECVTRKFKQPEAPMSGDT